MSGLIDFQQGGTPNWLGLVQSGMEARQKYDRAQLDQRQRETAFAARPQIAQRVDAGDFAGARSMAAATGNAEYGEAIAKLSAERQSQLADHADMLGSVAISLKGLPAEQRAARLQALAPQLMQRGFSAEELQSADLSDGGLDGYIGIATSAKDAFAAYNERNKPHELSSGERLYGADGTLIAENPRAPDWVFDSESGSWLQKPGTGPGGVPAVGLTVPQQPAMGNDGGTFGRMLTAESGGQQFTNGRVTTSPKGALGIAQIMPATAPEAAALAGVPYDPERLRTDAAYNRQLGEAYYNKQFQDFGGDPAKAAAAYNAGPGRLRQAIARGGDNWIAHVPDETKAYVAKVTGGQGGAPQVQQPTPGVIRARPPKRKEAPSGYQWQGDRLAPIPGGPADASTATARNVESNRKGEAAFRKEFDALPEVKDFKKARTQFNALRETALNPKATAQDDIAVIFQFMKTLDPTSTVREGEFATAQNSAGIPETIRNAFNKAQNGERLNQEQRRNMARTAYRSYKAYRDAYNQAAENYRGYARDSGLNADRVARTYTPDPAPRATPRPAPQMRAGESRSVGGITIKALN